MWARIWPTSSPCWSVRNRPASASRSAGSLLRSRPLANAASTSGLWVPATRASSIARPETPMMSVATLDSSGPGVLQDLVQPLDLPAAFLDLGLAVAGQLAQLPDRAGRPRSWGGPARARPAGRSRPRRPHRSYAQGRCACGPHSAASTPTGPPAAASRLEPGRGAALSDGPFPRPAPPNPACELAPHRALHQAMPAGQPADPVAAAHGEGMAAPR